ncbi:hypothetical protein [Clostridium septicum]|uniref:Uncharacterized protein n=1 Tax=Clostridium septicum TaxID=1504 RepID=A0ABY5AYZ3_CLOSE|nr:hypothetical protein [Clostridium septicum]UEC21284.1 hypothetical protein LK444_02600 [Clostridium septicum]USS00672.1 hypothetical protein NH397_14500 [Clostridium septicum]
MLITSIASAASISTSNLPLAFLPATLIIYFPFLGVVNSIFSSLFVSSFLANIL